MSQKLGREPTNLELSLYLDVSEEDVDNAIIATDSIDSLDNHLDIYNKDNETSADIMDLRAEINNLPEDDKNIILARYYYDLTQSEISKLLNISQVAYSYYELNKRNIPLELLSKLADYYNTSIDYLVYRTDEIKPYKKPKK